MGVVYRARQLKFNRLVALKMVLAGSHASETDLARFLAEAEAVAQLQHTNVVQVFDADQHAGLPYFTMEFISGGSLAERLRGTPLPPSRSAALVEQLARGVHAAHERGIIHRDLKPGNVLLTAEETPKLTDFGLARRLAGGSGMTATGAVLGTPSYMAPEQAQGKGKHVGPPADIYALGAILYECLTGRPPFQGPTPLETLAQLVSDDPVAPRRLQPKIPADLETICLKCLQKEPTKRYASALELAADLQRFQAGETIQARPAGPGERAVKWVKRRPALAALTGTILVAVLGLLGGGAWFTFQLNEARLRAEESADAEREARADADRKAEEARRNLYISDMNLVQREYEVNHIAHVRELLDSWIPKSTAEKDLRGFEWHYWQLRAHRELLTLNGHTEAVFGVCFSPDGSRLASASWDNTVKIWDSKSGQELLTLKGHTEGISRVCFSPDGIRLASASADHTVKVWDSRSGLELLTFKQHTGPVAGVCFSPDGTRLASAGGEVKVWDSTSGKELFTLKGQTSGAGSVSFSPDGSRLAFSGADRTVKVWDCISGQEPLTFKGHTGTVSGVCFSPDGTRLASASNDRTVKVWDSHSGQELLTLQGHSQWVLGVCFSPDGIRLASVSGMSEMPGEIKVWDSTTGQELLTLKGHTSSVIGISFNPDGTRLASAGGFTNMPAEVKVWESGSGQELLTLKGQPDWVRCARFSPDGTRLVSASGERTAQVWDSGTGHELFTLRGNTSSILGVCYNPDGSRLASVSGGGTVEVWNSSSGQKLLAFKYHASQIRGPCFSPDGARLALASGEPNKPGEVKVWDSSTGRELLTLKGHSQPVSWVCFSPEGTRLASASWDQTVKVWDSTSGEELLTLKGHAHFVNSVCFSPDGRRLASASADHTVKVWNCDNGQELFTLQGHTNGVQKVCFSPDGRRLASAGFDGMVRLWDSDTGKELMTLKPDYQVFDLCFSPDGTRLVAAGNARTIKIWESQPVLPDTVRRRELVEKVQTLFSRSLVKDQVLRELRMDSSLTKPDRRFTLEIAQTHADNAFQLNEFAWGLVRGSGGKKEAYAKALRAAQAAVQAETENGPNFGNYLNTLGVAHYRLGEYDKALETLLRSEKLNATEGGSHPGDLAFLAMTKHQLGQKDEAQTALAQLRQVMKNPGQANIAEAQGFLREAEELIEGKPAEKQK
jgi:WD40 repeat protein